MITYNIATLAIFLSEVNTLQRNSECEYLFDFRGWKETANDDRVYVLIKLQDKLIGFSIIEPITSRLSRIFVQEQYRNKTILSYILEEYKIKTLGVFTNIPNLVRYYKSFGFTITNPQAKLVFNMEKLQ